MEMFVAQLFQHSDAPTRSEGDGALLLRSISHAPNGPLVAFPLSVEPNARMTSAHPRIEHSNI